MFLQNEQRSAESVPHSLCSAFGMIGSHMTSHQSLVRPLPSADIAEHRASYTSALLGLCLQSEREWGGKGEGERERGRTLSHCGPSCQDGETRKEESGLTSKMIPLRTSFESTPTFRSSRHSLSNFSGVSLLSMLQGEEKQVQGMEGWREGGRRKRRRST